MNGTTVIYNDVRLVNVATRQCEEDFILDPSGTDIIGHRLLLTWDTTCHVQHLAEMLHGVDGYSLGFSGSSTAELFALARCKLSEERKLLTVYVDNDILFQVWPANQASVNAVPNFDINNGPHPKRVMVRQIVGSEIVYISFSIEATTGFCCDGSKPYIVVSNKWSVAEERDSNFFTTRRITGQVRLAHGLYAGHAFLPWCVPGLEYGFKRESISFDAAANGLDASYQIIDRQVHTAAPWPATEISGTYSWSTTLESGNWLHHAEFSLKGAPNSDVKKLVARAVELCDARIKYLSQQNPLSGTRPMLMNECSIVEHVGVENSVRANMTVTMYPSDPTSMIANIVNDQIGAKIELQPAGEGKDAIPYDPGVSPVPAMYGYVPRKDGVRSPVTLFLLHCYQQDPCSPVKGMYQWANGTGKPPTDDYDKSYPDELTPVSPGSIPPGDMGKFDPAEQGEGVYTLVRMSSSYRTHNRRAQLSIADDWTPLDADPSCVVVKTGRPLSRRVVRYEAERQDKPPTLPQLSDELEIEGFKHTLLDSHITVCAPKATADGLHWIHRVQAWYLFALDRPVRATDKLPMGLLPIHNEQQTLDMDDRGDESMYGE